MKTNDQINGVTAVQYLEKTPTLVGLLNKDNTNKFWSYRMRKGSQREFAFDPKTKTKLIIRFDVEPPRHPDIVNVERVGHKSVSTALSRVFSGGTRTAKFKATVRTEEALQYAVGYLARL